MDKVPMIPDPSLGYPVCKRRFFEMFKQLQYNTMVFSTRRGLSRATFEHHVRLCRQAHHAAGGAGALCGSAVAGEQAVRCRRCAHLRRVRTRRGLRRLLSPDGAAEYKAWHQQSRSMLEVLEEFSSCRPPLGELPAFSFRVLTPLTSAL